MAYRRFHGFDFSHLEDFSLKGEIVFDHVAGTYRINGQSGRPSSDLPAMRIALDELAAEIADSSDPVTDGSKILPSGETLVYNPVASTIKFGSAPTLSVDLAMALRETLIDLGLG